MATAWNNTNLGEMAKMLGGLVSQSEVYPFVMVESTGYSTGQVYSRSGAEITGYCELTYTDEGFATIDTPCVKVFNSVYLEILSHTGNVYIWSNGATVRPKFIIEFTR